MNRRAILPILLALAVAGCGDDGAEKAAKPKAKATPAGAELRKHMLAEGELKGAEFAGTPQLVTTPDAWVLPSGRKDAAAVRASGFVEGMEQRFHLAAINLAARYETPEQATAETEFVPPVEDIGSKEFEVPGIPGAIGRRTSSDLHANGNNISFTTGEFFHLVAAKESDVSQKDLIAAAQRLYDRVR